MADEVISVGKTDSLQGKRKYHKDQNGSSTTITHTGDLANMSSLYNQYYANGYVVDLEEDEAETWNLTATIAVDLSTQEPTPGGGGGTNEVPEISWDLDDKVENKSILDVDNYIVNLIPNFAAKLINDALQAKKEDVLLNGLNLYYKNGQISAASREAAIYIYHHMATGMKTVPVLVPVLTKYAVTSRSWIINWSNQNKGKIYSTNTLINSEAVDPRLWQVLPQDVYIPSGGEDFYIPKAYGWLKGGVRSQVSNNGRNIVTQTWEYGLYPTLIFGNPI